MQASEWESYPNEVVQRLMMDCLKSRADSTVRRYIREVVAFLDFMRCKSLPESFPVTVGQASFYLSFLLGKKRVSAVSMAHAALKWIHGFLPIYYNPLDAALCKNLVEAEKRQRTTPIRKKEPASPGLIKQIITHFGGSNAKLKDLRSAAMMVLSFAGLFRSKELLNIRVCDVHFESDHMRIRVPSSKTDVYRDGQDIFISELNNEFCPVNLLSSYVRKGAITVNELNKDYLFRSLVYLKATKLYTLGKRAVSYTRFRELFKDCLKHLGYDEKLYSLHSFRAGGATSIVSNFKDIKSKERLLKIHGRWKTDIAKDMYIKEDLEERLRVSKCMGL